jgi:hypothetical protein
MSSPDNTRTIELLAQLSQTADFSVGCYCDNESRCHRSDPAHAARRARREVRMTPASPAGRDLT